MKGQDNAETYTTVIKTIQGEKTAFGLTPNEMFVDLPVTRPNYVRVREGHLLQEGDVLTKEVEKTEGSEIRSAALKKWEVVEITPDTVRGKDVEGDAEETWEREWVEQQLATGGLSTNLTDFDRISIHQIGSGEQAVSNYETAEQTSDEPRLIVLVYGNNGQKFGLTYRFVGRDTDTEIELVQYDRLPEGVDADLRKTFDERVQEALTRDGYHVQE